MAERTSDQGSIGEALTIKIRLGFLLTAIAGLISLVAIFISLRSDVIALLSTVQTQQRIIEQVQSVNIDLKLKIQSIDDSLSYLRESVERDQKWHQNNR